MVAVAAECSGCCLNTPAEMPVSDACLKLQLVYASCAVRGGGRGRVFGWRVRGNRLLVWGGGGGGEGGGDGRGALALIGRETHHMNLLSLTCRVVALPQYLYMKVL